ncbi:MAG: hypothetical protein KIG60_03815 [Caryophanon sp.]|nr:hypothetical protein [Caryophanon sp.]
MSSGVVRQYILGMVLLAFSIYLSINDSTWWILSFVLGVVLLLLGNFNRRKSSRQPKE